MPALALFEPSRFTAIIAAVAYAVPIATKLVADGSGGFADHGRGRHAPVAAPGGR